MNKLDIENFNLEATLLGGQSFTWEKIDGSYYGTHKNVLIEIQCKSNKIFWQTYPKLNDESLIKSYLNLDFDYPKAIESILIDNYIKAATKANSGVRILNQDFETVLLNFILSSHKSVKGVRKLVKDISKKYGQEFNVGNVNIHSFPSSEVIAKLTEKQLRAIGAGFRAPYLKSAAEKLVKDKKFIRSLNLKNTKELKEYLISFKGIGDKIADCILVFGLSRVDITPLDIWAKRVLTDFYNLDPKMSYSLMSEWYTNYFGENTAIAGQILFEYIRNAPKPNRKRK